MANLRIDEWRLQFFYKENNRRMAYWIKWTGTASWIRLTAKASGSNPEKNFNFQPILVLVDLLYIQKVNEKENVNCLFKVVACWHWRMKLFSFLPRIMREWTVEIEDTPSVFRFDLRVTKLGTIQIDKICRWHFPANIWVREESASLLSRILKGHAHCPLNSSHKRNPCTNNLYSCVGRGGTCRHFGEFHVQAFLD